ncbi:thioredoxin [Clostridium perfringens]|uniref:Thioredoxin n=1 Tax=Clostridium perfringens TaxID=1502 RepID=A0A133NER1_CLOPF|nr:thioredoxin family protein [Clostridium perfringens]EGT3600102.1 thioredoxin family protein [Clostridium perfringens]EGT5620413.1 thioredoxin [Clostridium perfringens]EIL8446199.1 thioredoxin family protein [Clostridium perfringens]ELC8379735.1 thioredoxin family protein [Clostridium perfringens]KXA14768.1 thioredoxin [Clostridium perfringens]
MRIIDNEKEFKEFCNEKGIRLAYLSTNTCCACGVLKPKIEELIKKYDNAKIIEVQADKSVDIVAQLSIFMFPAIILYIDGKEILREAKYISVVELEKVIDRYFELYN